MRLRLMVDLRAFIVAMWENHFLLKEIRREQKIIMATLDELTASVAGLATSVQANSDAVNKYISEAQSHATPPDFQPTIDALTSAKTGLDATTTAVINASAALNPVPPDAAAP